MPATKKNTGTWDVNNTMVHGIILNFQCVKVQYYNLQLQIPFVV